MLSDTGTKKNGISLGNDTRKATLPRKSDLYWEAFRVPIKSGFLTGIFNTSLNQKCPFYNCFLFRYLNMSLTEGSGIRKADGRSVISRVAINEYGRDLAFDFIRDNWDRVHA